MHGHPRPNRPVKLATSPLWLTVALVFQLYSCLMLTRLSPVMTMPLIVIGIRIMHSTESLESNQGAALLSMHGHMVITKVMWIEADVRHFYTPLSACMLPYGSRCSSGHLTMRSCTMARTSSTYGRLAGSTVKQACMTPCSSLGYTSGLG